MTKQAVAIDGAEKEVEKPAPNPWELQEFRDMAETEGTLFKWKFDWTLTLRRISGWNKNWSAATARLNRRPDVKAFLQRMNAKDYEWTDKDRLFWRRVELEQFGEGCVVNWSVTDRTGKPMSMTPKNIVDVFTTFPDFYLEAKKFASDADNFSPEAIDPDIALGNS